MIDIFIPSYHRANNLKTVNYFLKIGWKANRIHVVIDSEADDFLEYEEKSKQKGFNLYVFDISDARKNYDFVHRPSVSRRAAGMARNMFYDIAKKKGISFYMVQDDDTQNYQIKKAGKYLRMANLYDIEATFNGIKEFMQRQRIGCFGVSQTGDFIGGTNKKLLRHKVMNTTFIDTRFIYKGEKGVQDDDTSQFVNIMNEGYFTGSLGDGLVLQQTQSATAKGGLTDLYNECKLLNKSLVTPIQFPSSIEAVKQSNNGGRLHHQIKRKHLSPMLLKGTKRSNIAWDTYLEDKIFSCEPVRNDNGLH